MIIKAKSASLFWLKAAGYWLNKVFKVFYFNRLTIRPVEIKSGHSYILMSNHFSFMDGFLAFYLVFRVLIKQGKMKGLHIMVLKKQMEKHWWLKHCGCFSVDPGKGSLVQTITYAAEILNDPGNVLLFFPQGNLESCHVSNIQFQEGISEIVSRVKGNCQLLWSSNIVEYFESIRPSIYFDMLDCGTNHEFDFDALQQQVNVHHREAIKRNVRFTYEQN